MKRHGKTGSRRARAGLPLAREGKGARPGGGRRVQEPVHQLSATAVAAEALRSGIVPHAVRRRAGDDAIPGEGERIRAGDPDDEALSNEYVGEDVPGGSTPTPDQNNVDDIGRAYGLQDEDSGELHTSAALMARRDQRRRGFSLKRHA
jgi:hypothetical protein